jgi:hypothetical protein
MGICLIFLCYNGNAFAADGTVFGHVYQINGTTGIDGLLIVAQNSSTGEFVKSVSSEIDGSYSLSLPAGSYKIQACASCSEKNYVNQYFNGVNYQDLASAVSVTADQNIPVDFLLEQGGYISGTITTDSPVNNLDDIRVRVRDEHGWISEGPVNSDGSYATYRLPPGSYRIYFADNGHQFQEEFYDNTPPWSQETATLVTVSEGNNTPDIDVALKAPSDDRYFIGSTMIMTYHTYDDASMNTNTESLAYASVNRFSDGRKNLRETINSNLVVVNPSGTCTQNSYELGNQWRLQLTDTNDNGIIDDSEWAGPQGTVMADKFCELSNTPHHGGDYSFTLTLSDNTTILTQSITAVPAGLSVTELPPVTHLAASWNNTDKEMDIAWSLPDTTYPDDAYLQIRVFFYNNGHSLQNQIRIQNLPTTLTNFTLDSKTTAYFDTELVNQIVLDVRVITDNSNTVMRTRKTYSFNSETGLLVAAPITMKLLDVDGDNRTGLAEAIYSLQAVSEN